MWVPCNHVTSWSHDILTLADRPDDEWLPEAVKVWLEWSWVLVHGRIAISLSFGNLDSIFWPVEDEGTHLLMHMSFTSSHADRSLNRSSQPTSWTYNPQTQLSPFLSLKSSNPTTPHRYVHTHLTTHYPSHPALPLPFHRASALRYTSWFSDYCFLFVKSFTPFPFLQVHVSLTLCQ